MFRIYFANRLPKYVGFFVNIMIYVVCREIGSDIAANSKVLNKMEVISAGHIGVLAAIGHSKVKVFK